MSNPNAGSTSTGGRVPPMSCCRTQDTQFDGQEVIWELLCETTLPADRLVQIFQHYLWQVSNDSIENHVLTANTLPDRASQH